MGNRKNILIGNLVGFVGDHVDRECLIPTLMSEMGFTEEEVYRYVDDRELLLDFFIENAKKDIAEGKSKCFDTGFLEGIQSDPDIRLNILYLVEDYEEKDPDNLMGCFDLAFSEYEEYSRRTEKLYEDILR